MRTYPLLLLALLLGALPASAKLSFVAAAPVAAAPAPPDTAAALHHLFARQRRHRRRAVLGATGAGAVLAGAAVIDAGHQNDGLAQGLDIGAAILSGLVAGIVGLVLLVVYDRYSRQHERRALNLLRYHQLPPDLARELEPQDFQAALAPCGPSPTRPLTFFSTNFVSQPA